jgi:hypothetical protein
MKPRNLDSISHLQGVLTKQLAVLKTLQVRPESAQQRQFRLKLHLWFGNGCPATCAEAAALNEAEVRQIMESV